MKSKLAEQHRDNVSDKIIAKVEEKQSIEREIRELLTFDSKRAKKRKDMLIRRIQAIDTELELLERADDAALDAIDDAVAEEKDEKAKLIRSQLDTLRKELLSTAGSIDQLMTSVEDQFPAYREKLADYVKAVGQSGASTVLVEKFSRSLDRHIAYAIRANMPTVFQIIRGVGTVSAEHARPLQKSHEVVL